MDGTKGRAVGRKSRAYNRRRRKHTCERIGGPGMYGAPKPLVFLSVFLLAALGWSGVSFGQKVAAPRGELGSVSVRHYRELRIVDKNPNNWVWITLNVFEYLMELDRDGTLVPRLATSWRRLDDRTLEAKLRQGVEFQTRPKLDAAVGKVNWGEPTR